MRRRPEISDGRQSTVSFVPNEPKLVINRDKGSTFDYAFIPHYSECARIPGYPADTYRHMTQTKTDISAAYAYYYYHYYYYLLLLLLTKRLTWH